MINFTTLIQKFGSHGDKTGWTYVVIPSEIAQQLKPDTKVSFSVNGKLDDVTVQGISLLPMGDGDFILPLKADLRRKLHKSEGAVLQIELQADTKAYLINKELLKCLKDSPAAASSFNKLTRSHQNYFSKWIDSAKTEATKAKRIAQALEALEHNLSYPEMIRKQKTDNSF